MNSLLLFLLLWGNGQAGNASTNQPAECASPPYSTHDWVADHALALMPENYWLHEHRVMYLLGTEAPDNDDIPIECGAPHTGYDDRRRGHSVDWDSDHANMTNDRAAMRAEEEFEKAQKAISDGDEQSAAFYLGAMAHYIGDVGQYGHSYPGEKNHGNYESWVGRRTKTFDGGTFEVWLRQHRRDPVSAYEAVSIISKATSEGTFEGILPAERMDELYHTRPTEFVRSIGLSLNLTVNTLTRVLRSFPSLKSHP